MPKVLIVIGSKSDQEYADKCRDQLKALGIESSLEITSAHRHPQKTAELTGGAEKAGFDAIIAMAGLSAALPGVAAAHSNLPVIGVPLPAALNGLDSLLSDQEARKLSKRVKRGVRSSAMAGKPYGRKLYGYDRVYSPDRVLHPLRRIGPDPGVGVDERGVIWDLWRSVGR